MSGVRKSMRLLFTVLFFITLACSSICISPLYAKDLDEIHEIVVFGDSLSDTGNLYFATLLDPNEDPFPASPYDGGRFSNGQVWVEYLAKMVDDLNDHVKVDVPTPSILGGTNYAWGGAETGDGVALVNNFSPNIGVQIDSFLASNRPKDNQLFILWAGANDFYSAGVPTEDVIVNAVDNIIEHIRTLALSSQDEELQLMVANLPPLGQTPKVQWLSFLSSLEDPHFDLAGYVDGLSVSFNTLLDSELDDLKQELKQHNHIKLIFYKLDSYSLFQNIGSSFTMERYSTGVYKTVRGTEGANWTMDGSGCPLDVTKFPLPPDYEYPYPAYAEDGVGADASPFFDDMHPTTIVHEIIAIEAFELIDAQSIETEYAE